LSLRFNAGGLTSCRPTQSIQKKQFRQQQASRQRDLAEELAELDAA